MIYMSQKKFKSELEKAKNNNLSRERHRLLKKERMKYWPKFRMPHTSKLVLLVAFLLCIEVLAFCQYVIITTGDTSALYSMIGVVASLVPVILGYYSKARAENTVGGITFETAMSTSRQTTDTNEEIPENAVG